MEPVWRQVFDAVERRVAFRAERIVNSNEFADAVGAVARLRRLAYRELTRSTRRWLHLWNLPAASDVSRLLAEVGQLRRQVGRLQEGSATDEEHPGVRALRP